MLWRVLCAGWDRRRAVDPAVRSPESGHEPVCRVRGPVVLIAGIWRGNGEAGRRAGSSHARSARTAATPWGRARVTASVHPRRSQAARASAAPAARGLWHVRRRARESAARPCCGWACPAGSPSAARQAPRAPRPSPAGRAQGCTARRARGSCSRGLGDSTGPCSSFTRSAAIITPSERDSSSPRSAGMARGGGPRRVDSAYSRLRAALACPSSTCATASRSSQRCRSSRALLLVVHERAERVRRARERTKLVV